jgi:hypothetical protein
LLLLYLMFRVTSRIDDLSLQIAALARSMSLENPQVPGPDPTP